MKYIKIFENFSTADIPQVHPRFWEFVKKMDWAMQGNYSKEHIIEKIVPTFTWKEFEMFREDYDMLYKFIGTHMKKIWLGKPGLGVGDDSWSDLKSSIIGNGRKSYYTVLLNHFNGNHILITHMADRSDYQENFGYTFNQIEEDEWNSNI